MNYEDIHRMFQVLAAVFAADKDLAKRQIYVQPGECTEIFPPGKVVKFTIEYVDEAEILPLKE